MIRFLYVEDFPPPIDYCDKQIMRLVNAGRFPKLVRIGQRKAWPEKVIAEFLENLPTEPRQANGCPSFTSERARAAVNVRWAKYRANKAAEREGGSEAA